MLFSTLVVVFSPYLFWVGFNKRDLVKDILVKSSRKPIKEDDSYQDDDLTNQSWTSAVGKLYLNAVEYQKQEGFCGSATLRSIMKSIPSILAEEIPPAKSGPMTLSKFSRLLDELSKGKTRSRVVFGSDGYDAFLTTLKQSNDVNRRVAINFLRSPLFGSGSSYNPFLNVIKRFFGGHFSVIVGYNEAKDRVAVFDVNSSYGGLYHVSSRRLFDSVQTFDLQSGESRGLVEIEVV